MFDKVLFLACGHLVYNGSLEAPLWKPHQVESHEQDDQNSFTYGDQV